MSRVSKFSLRDIFTTVVFIGFVIIAFAAGILFVLSRVQPIICHPDIKTVPPFLSLKMCETSEVTTGATTLVSQNGSEYIVTFETVNYETKTVSRFTVKHPGYEKPFEYEFSNVENISDTYLVGEIALQRYIGKWYVRYPDGWTVNPRENLTP